MTLKQKANQNQGSQCCNSRPVDLAGFDVLSVGSALPESSNAVSYTHLTLPTTPYV